MYCLQIRKKDFERGQSLLVSPSKSFSEFIQLKYAFRRCILPAFKNGKERK